MRHGEVMSGRKKLTLWKPQKTEKIKLENRNKIKSRKSVKKFCKYISLVNQKN